MRVGSRVRTPAICWWCRSSSTHTRFFEKLIDSSVWPSVSVRWMPSTISLSTPVRDPESSFSYTMRCCWIDPSSVDAWARMILSAVMNWTSVISSARHRRRDKSAVAGVAPAQTGDAVVDGNAHPNVGALLANGQSVLASRVTSVLALAVTGLPMMFTLGLVVSLPGPFGVAGLLFVLAELLQIPGGDRHVSVEAAIRPERNAHRRIFGRIEVRRPTPLGRSRDLRVGIGRPVGSGKTALAASYVETRRRPSGWYQLDARDGDLATFFYYMALLARQVAPARRGSLPVFTPAYRAGIPAWFHRGTRRPDPLEEELPDLFDHVSVGRRLLHRLGCALHVHQDEAGTCFRDERFHAGIEPQGADVIDEHGARVERLPCHDGLSGIDRDRHRHRAAHRPDDGDQSPALLLLIHRLRSRPGGFRADVDQVGPF